MNLELINEEKLPIEVRMVTVENDHNYNYNKNM